MLQAVAAMTPAAKNFVQGKPWSGLWWLATASRREMAALRDSMIEAAINGHGAHRSGYYTLTEQGLVYVPPSRILLTG